MSGRGQAGWRQETDEANSVVLLADDDFQCYLSNSIRIGIPPPYAVTVTLLSQTTALQRPRRCTDCNILASQIRLSRGCGVTQLPDVFRAVAFACLLLL